MLAAVRFVIAIAVGRLLSKRDLAVDSPAASADEDALLDDLGEHGPGLFVDPRAAPREQALALQTSPERCEVLLTSCARDDGLKGIGALRQRLPDNCHVVVYEKCAVNTFSGCESACDDRLCDEAGPEYFGNEKNMHSLLETGREGYARCTGTCSCVLMPNRGKEFHSALHFVANNYDDLPDVFINSPANLNHGSNRLHYIMALLNARRGAEVSVESALRTEQPPTDNREDFGCIVRWYDKIYSKPDPLFENFTTSHGELPETFENTRWPNVQDFAQRVLGMDWQLIRHLPTCHNGPFLTTRALLRRHPREFYARLAKIMSTGGLDCPRPCVHKKYLADPPEGWLIERLAQVVFGYGSEYLPAPLQPQP